MGRSTCLLLLFRGLGLVFRQWRMYWLHDLNFTTNGFKSGFFIRFISQENNCYGLLEYIFSLYFPISILSVYEAKFSRSTFQMPCFYQFLSTFSLGGDRICIGQAKMGTKFSNTSFKQLISGNLFQFVSYKNLFFL